MIPVLVTAPIALPVDLSEAKAHCRIDHNDDDVLIESYIGAATGHLDAWTGILGRCIMPQVWRVSAPAGDVVLPFPNVTEATAAYVAGPAPLTITATALGPCVTLSEACDVTFSCAMPAHLLAAVKVIVLMLIGHWYKTREAVGDATAEVPMAAEAMIAQMRWRRI